MVSTYTKNGGIELIGTGEQSGTWGTTTNTNFDIIDRLTNGVIEIDVGSSSTSNLDTSDGTVTNGMSKVLVYTTSGTQSTAHTVTITIVDAEKLYFINNTLGQNLQFVQDGSTPTDCVIAANTAGIIYARGNTVSGSARLVNLTSLFPNANTGGTGTFTSITANGGVNVDNITIDGTEIDLSSGDLTVDVEGNIDLDANGGTVKVSDDGTEILNITNSTGDVIIKPVVDAKDIIFQQRDGTEVARIKDDGTFNIVTDKLAINGVPVTSSADELNKLEGATVTTNELNLLDGDTANDSSITVADADGILVDDNGTMKKVPASDIKSYATAGATSGTVTQVGTGAGLTGTVTTSGNISMKTDFLRTNASDLFQLPNNSSSFTNPYSEPVFVIGTNNDNESAEFQVTIGGTSKSMFSGDGNSGPDVFAFVLPSGATISRIAGSGNLRGCGIKLKVG